MFHFNIILLLLEHLVAIENAFFRYGHFLLDWLYQSQLVLIRSHPEEEACGAAHKASEILVFASDHRFEHTSKRALHVHFRIVAQLVKVFHQVGRSLEEAAPS